MNKQTITFTASEQTLTKTGGIEHYASNIVSYIEASFTLGDNWAGYDSIRAVWESGYARIATVLDANNKCIVPAEVLTYKSKVNVNLVGSIVENTVLTDRLTTYPILALTVDADARVDSSETTPVTASQFEQFVDVVRDEASAIQNYTYDSEAWAVGQRAGVDVPSTDETYQNNAKYYADQGATLQQEVTDLKSDFNEYVYSESNSHVALSLQYNGYYNTSGVFVSEVGRSYAVVTDVSAGEEYLLTTAIRSGLIPAIEYFNGNTFLSYEKAGTGTTEYLTDYAVTVPTNCNKIIVQNTDAGSITLKKVVKTPYYYPRTYLDTILSKRIGKNLFDRSKSVDGYLTSTGGLTSYLDWKTSDFIDVSDLDAVTLSNETGSGRFNLNLSFLCTYGENKTFIEQVGSTVASPYTIPNGVKYIRFSYRNGSVYDVQLESGSVITNYVPYKEYNVVIDSPYENGNSEYDGVTWAVFGDSLTEKNAKAVTSYYDYVSQALGCSIVNYGKSGTGYAKNSSGSDNFVARMLNINPNAFDVLTIFGSFNDISSGLEIGEPTDTGTTTICGCINTTIDNFYSVAPYKPIGLVTPTPWASVPTDSAWANQYADAIIAIGKRRGIPVMDLFRASGIRPWAGSAYIAEYYTEGGVADIGAHPNSKGHKVFLYPHFREFLKTLV